MQDGLILLVGDDHAAVPTLEAAGYQIMRAESGFSALGLLEELEPDLILLDFDLPGLGGIDTLMALKGNPETHRIGVLVMGDVPNDLAAAFAAGADEFMVVAAHEHELLVRAAHLIDKKRQADVLYRQAHYDALTGIFNRGSFMERLERHAMRLVRSGKSLCCVMVDLDKFKALNDTHGHLAGDVVLRQVAEVLRRNIRATDCVGRYGGEEFTIALPETHLMGGVAAAKRLRDTVSSTIRFDGSRITASFGVAQASREDDLGTLLERADRAMYHGKHAGGNLVGYEHEGMLGFAAD